MTDVPEYEAFTSLRSALIASLESTPHLPRDRALIALALRYADMIDDAQDRLGEAGDEDEARDLGRMIAIVAKIGPRLEAVLDKMGMSPGARPATGGGAPLNGTDPGSTALAALQSGRPGSPAPGIDYAAAVDPAVTEADTED